MTQYHVQPLFFFTVNRIIDSYENLVYIFKKKIVTWEQATVAHEKHSEQKTHNEFEKCF